MINGIFEFLLEFLMNGYKNFNKLLKMNILDQIQINNQQMYYMYNK